MFQIQHLSIKYCLISLSFLLLPSLSFAQDTLIQSPIPGSNFEAPENRPWQFSGYVETYYLFDFNKPTDNYRPGFVYSHNRHNEVNLNLGFLKASYTASQVRANLAFMAGTYANANLSAEPGVLRNILEANAGVKLSKTKNLWIDAGVFNSHIGFESAIGKDCWNITRSIQADNSPYFESGAKISYTTQDEKWFVSGLLLNGWQRIQRSNGNSTPAFGHQLTFKPNDKITLNSSSFIGSDKPDSLRQMRYFHNLYGIFQISPKVSLIGGFDIGAEQKFKESSTYNTWFSPILIARLAVSEKIAIGLRGEYYQDVHGVIIETGTRNGFQTFGFSVNLDLALQDNFLWRVEARSLNSKDPIFTRDGLAKKDNFILATCLAISF
jgi:hypothetical protein